MKSSSGRMMGGTGSAWGPAFDSAWGYVTGTAEKAKSPEEEKALEEKKETEVQVARTFKQRQALGVGAHKGAESDQGVPGDKSGQSAKMRSVLGMVFGK